MGKFVKISKFSKIAGVTRQAVYGRINSDKIKNFTKVDNNGNMLINTDALRYFKNNANYNDFNDVNNEQLKIDYLQLKLQYEKLKQEMELIGDRNLKCPKYVYNRQLEVMKEYLEILETRAVFEKIEI